MKKRFRIRILLSLFLAITAGFLTYNYLGGLEKDVSIVVASKDIDANEMLTQNNLKVMTIDIDEKSKYFPNAVSRISEVSGGITRLRISEGTPISKDPDALMYGEERTVALNYDGSVDDAYFIPSDKRVIAVETDGVGAVGSQLKAGDFVDIIYTANDEMGSGMFSNMLLQHIQIFDVKTTNVTDLGPNAGSKVQLLLMATPEESLELTMAKRTGVLDFVLNPLEGETVDLMPIHVSHLSAQPDMTNGETLDYLADQIIEEEIITESAKLEMLMIIEAEKSIDKISNMISASNIDPIDRQNVLNMLSGISGTSPNSLLTELDIVMDTVEDSWLEEEERVMIADLIDSEVDNILEIQKNLDLKMIIEQIERTQLSDDIKKTYCGISDSCR